MILLINTGLNRNINYSNRLSINASQQYGLYCTVYESGGGWRLRLLGYWNVENDWNEWMNHQTTIKKFIRESKINHKNRVISDTVLYSIDIVLKFEKIYIV
jgi:hypothetical protein